MNWLSARAAVAAAVLSAASAAHAGGDSGTSSMGEMQLTGTHFLFMVGGLAGMGVVVWLLAKVVNR
ncbi:MAG TPA: hypothetical protein VLC54_09075 [Anaeromyxobacter sp.]|nr:hypothetical protein [Anaeromyxobacter sp.]